MQSSKQSLWFALLMAAGCVAGWFFTPPSRRNFTGLFLACAVIVAILVAPGCRQRVRRERYRERYFARCLRYDLLNGSILVMDNRSPRVITLDPSLVLIFGAADGQRTAQQFISELEGAFPGTAPPSVARQTYQLMTKMEEQGLIRFADQKTQLPYYLSIPISQQDKAKAVAEMKRDGFIK